MVCIETSFIIDLFRGDPALKQAIADLTKNSRLSIAAPSITELWYGSLIAKSSLQEKEKINELLNALTVLELDEKCAKETAEIKFLLNKQGMQMQTADIFIAGIARAHNETLLTRDSDYARIPGLKILKH